MPKQVKLPEEDLQKIREVRSNYSEIINTMGPLSLQIYDLKKMIEELQNKHDDLLRKYDEIKEIEKNLMNELTQKYGTGQLNIETGVLETPEENSSTENMENDAFIPPTFTEK